MLVAGGGFAGGYVARLLGRRGATIVSPENFMLYTPLLPEAASGTLEPRHVVVPLRQMCPHAEMLLGRVTAIDAEQRTAHVETPEAGSFEIAWDNLVLALGAVARTLPVPGLAEHAVGFKDLADAINLRNHVLRRARGCRCRARSRATRGAPVVRLRRCRLRGGRSARRALRSRRRRAALLPASTRGATALGARRRGAEDPARDPAETGRLRGARARAAGRRDPRLDDARVAHRRARPFCRTATASRRTRSSGLPA